MRPEAPPVYRKILLERWGALWRRLGFPARMILRRISRTKWRALLTTSGVAFSAAIVMLSFFPPDSVAAIIDHQYRLTERQDARVGLDAERGRAALYEIRRIPGVRAAEAELGVAVELVHGWRRERTAIQGLEPGQGLRLLLDRSLRPIPLPREGLSLSSKLAKLLDLRVGDEVEVRVLTGRKATFLAPIEHIVEEYMGTSAYADLSRLSRWIGEEMVLTSLLLSIESGEAIAVHRRLRDFPAISAVSLRARSVEIFQETVAETQEIMTAVLILFAGVIAFGVVYNAARISLAERERELGSMLILGFTRRETAAVLMGENLLLALLGTLPGLLLGTLLCWVLTRVYDTDLFRFPFVLRPRTFLWTVLTVLGFALLANLLVARRLSRIDIVGVLKTTE